MITSPSSGSLVWLNGALIRQEAAHTRLWAHHYGFGVFEGVRAYGTGQGAAIFRVDDHTARLYRSARILGMPLEESWKPGDIIAAQLDVIRENHLGDAYLRPFVFYDGVRGLSLHTDQLALHVAVVALPWVARASGRDVADGISVRTSSFIRHHPNSVLLRAKANGNYMSSILALAEAKASGVDDAILLDHEGFVAEGTGANIFLVRDQALWTAPATSALDGVTRDTIFVLAKRIGIRVQERRFARDDLYSADEAFFTGTAAEVTPIREIHGRGIGGGETGPLTCALARLYAATVRGLCAEVQGWITVV